MRLRNQVAIITAATDGIGLSIAQRFCEEGAVVIISSRKESNVEKAVEQLRSQGHESIFGVVCHVGKAEDRNALIGFAVEKFGHIDILVSNAACNPSGLFRYWREMGGRWKDLGCLSYF